MILATIAAAAVIVLNPPAEVWDAYDPYTNQPDPLADCLLAKAYHGVAGDHVERIYAPREWIEWCTARTDEQNAQQDGIDGGDLNTAVSVWWATGPTVNV